MRGRPLSGPTIARAAIALVAAGVVAGASCRKSAPGAPSGGSPPAATITISAAGVSPKNVEIALGDRVLFVNSDNKTHSIGSNPHPDHTDCPSINQAGFLGQGQSRETGNFVITRICEFHDHDDPLNQTLWGTITTK